ncbi:hypothetical protein EV385_4502 [Krasilnikovia cinnamomea]|uniref:Uncharacterized protein n=1 Tax=Krasilnikovia cinnamomea TaxID=349313 RepID=A0A4Q7ZNL4_9ACTN|nr:DUF6328 family protein [Krasilnikovia cinnamomea]RZU52628.1 hypothetical protein EV385_4502 [Krasilnikovia cinnamomea]
MGDEKGGLPGESERERWNRNFADLLQELRVAQTGVQILFAFLLTLPFSSGFPHTNAFQRVVYLVALISAAFATTHLIAPVAFHRALFRRGRKPELVRYAHRMATTGLAFMLISMVSSVLLITDYLLNRWAALSLTVFIGAWFLTYWVILPYVRRSWIDAEDVAEDREYAEDSPGEQR